MENNINEAIDSKKNDLAMNPFSFNGRSGRLNFLLYGILPALAIFGLGFYIHNQIVVIILLLLGVVMFFAALTRRGRDAGMSPLNSIGSYILSSALISSFMEQSLMSLKIVTMFDSPIIGMIIVSLMTNIVLVYLLLAPKSNKEIPKASTFSKILLGVLGVIVIGLLVAVALPKLTTQSDTNIQTQALPK